MPEVRKQLVDIIPTAVILLGLISAIALSSWMDQRRPALDPAVAEESLYLNGNTAKRLSLGFNGLAADWYWMRSLQYIGKKLLQAENRVQFDDLSSINLKLLPPLLDSATTLDPNFLEPYEYAAIVLPSVNVDEAIRITKKGIDANPSAWKLYQHLGYIYWQQKDFKTASEIYGAGAKIPDAPHWMLSMSARMAAEGGSRGVAREIYGRMLEEAQDPNVKEMARKRLMQVDSMDQRDALDKILSAYKGRTGACPKTWHEITGVLRAVRFPLDSTGAPVDPSGTRYQLVVDQCKSDLDLQSQVPAK